MMFYQYGRQCFYKYYYKSCKAKYILRKEYKFIFSRGPAQTFTLKRSLAWLQNRYEFLVNFDLLRNWEYFLLMGIDREIKYIV